MKKNKQQKSGELVFGVHPLLELLKAKRRKLLSIYTTKQPPKQWKQIEKLLPKYPINIQYVDKKILNNIAGTSDHQNIVAWAGKFSFRKKFFDSTREKKLLLLDSIQDARNLGAILRSAYCTGIDGVIITQKNSAPLNATAIKSSAGLAEHLEIYLTSSAQAAEVELTKAGYQLYLATIGGNNVLEIAVERPWCLVIGNEATGITKSILSAGKQVTLPQKDSDISYNASVAAGILLFLFVHKH